MPRRRHSWPGKSVPLRTFYAAIVLITFLVGNFAGVLWAEDEQRQPPQGLFVQHFADGRSTAVDVGLQGLPTYWLTSGESPDPRLGAGKWRITAQGELETLLAGEYQFSADVWGRLRMEFADQVLIEVDSEDGPRHVETEKLVLESKRHSLQIEYRPASAGARLRINWRHERFDWEPIPTAALSRVTDRAPGQDDSPLAIANSLTGSWSGVDDPLITRPSFNRGWQAVEKYRCHACHHSPLRDQMALLRGPTLTAAQQRLSRAWIAKWLADPGRQRPEATMPRLFSDDKAGEIQRQVIAEYLTNGEPGTIEVAGERTVNPDDAAAGKALFDRIGCANCHQSFQHRPAVVTLTRLETKTSAAALETFLQNPAAVRPDGRMPRFDLSPDERRQLAAYLLTKDGPPGEATPATIALPTNDVASVLRQYVADGVVAGFSPAEMRRELARQVILAKRCEACHELPEDSQRVRPALLTVDVTGGQARFDVGCLDKQRQIPGNGAPLYGPLHDAGAMITFLREAVRQPVTPAPSFQARLTLARLNCTACHDYEGYGGLPAELAAQLLAGQSETSAEAVHPPPLTDVAEKLTPAALHEVLVHGSRVRPWMSLRMPHFSGVEQLPQQLAALAGEARDEPLAESARQAGDDDQALEAARAAGRKLVGAGGFGCIKCHDLQGVASQGTRGPDLSLTPRRIQRDWYRRWMSDPQRIVPGTRMPTVFLDGQSPHAEILDGDPARQRDAIWDYLLASHAMPLPEGIERPTPQRLALGGRPLVVRTFLPGLSARGMAIGFAQDVHLLYDAQNCRLAGMFQGGFLDLSAAWSGRGGAAARIEGAIAWQAPAGFPWELRGRDDGPPDFSARAQDPALGGPVREAPPYAPSRLRFLGYSLDAAGPTMRFELSAATAEAGQGKPTVLGQFSERLTTVRTDLGIAARRDVTIRALEPQTAWLLAASADAPPTLLMADSAAPLGDEPAPIQGAALRVVQQGQPLLITARGHGANRWQAIERQGQWQVLLRSEPAPGTDFVQLQMDVWRPSRDREEVIHNLARYLVQTGER